MMKVKAFTLLELLIAMIISSIVISMGYGVYSLIYKHYLSYKKAKTEIINTMQFNTVFMNDFNNSEEITFNQNTVSIIDKNDKLFYYIFNETCILRKINEITDTFKIVATNIQEKFVFGDHPAHSTLISEFSFDAKLSGDKEYFLFKKNYSATTLLNKEVKFQQAE